MNEASSVRAAAKATELLTLDDVRAIVDQCLLRRAGSATSYRRAAMVKPVALINGIHPAAHEIARFSAVSAAPQASRGRNSAMRRSSSGAQRGSCASWRPVARLAFFATSARCGFITHACWML